MEVALAASRKCSEIMFRVHSEVSRRLRRVSLARERPPAKPIVKRGGSWFMRLV